MEEEQMKRNILVGMIAGLALLTLVGGASAGYIVDTGTTLGGSTWSLVSDQWLAAEFTIAESNTITSLEGYMWGAYGAPGTLTAAIYSDGGDLPGSLLYSRQFTAGTTSDWYGPAGLDWVLASGTYWAAFQVVEGDTYWGSLPGSAVTALDNEAYYWPGFGWMAGDYLDLGIRIGGDSAPVPEPGTFALLGLGMAGLAMCRRQRKSNRA